MIRKIRYGFGYCNLLLFLLSFMEPFNESLIFLATALICMPTYELFCKKLNRYPSFSRGILIYIVSFILCILLSEYTFNFIYIAFIFMVYYIIFSFVILITSKKKYEYSKRNFFSFGKLKCKLRDICKKLNITIYTKSKNNHKTDYLNKTKDNVTEQEFNHQHLFDKNQLTLSSTALSYLYKMLQEDNNKKQANECLKKVNFSELIDEFYSQTKNCKTLEEFNLVLTNKFYKEIITKHFSEVVNYIKRYIIFNTNVNERISILKNYNNIINNITINNTYKEFLEKYSCKFQLYSRIKIYRFDSQTIPHPNKVCNIELTYILETVALCETFFRLLVIEKCVINSNSKSDFYIMVSNMTKQIKDINLVENKIGKFYTGEFGYYSKHYLFKSILIFISEKENEKDFNIKKDFNNSIVETSNLQTIEEKMLEYSYSLVDKHANCDIELLMLNKIYTMLYENSFREYIYFLQRIPDYMSKLNYKREILKIEKEKERYLKGDFSNELKETSSEYLLNNIVTGVQFEEYLVRLFKELNYKAKHNGKSGDQGADLILKYNDYIYAIQAKFYTSKLDNTPVQEIVGALKYYNANQGVVITNSTFTKGAENLAKANNVILIDGNDLKKIIAYSFNENNEDILQKFI